MSRTSDVIKNKKKIERLKKEKRQNELSSIRNKSQFKSLLYNELRHIGVLLQDKDIKSVEVEIDDAYLSYFISSIYSEDLADYNVEQAYGEPNKFLISKKIIAF